MDKIAHTKQRRLLAHIYSARSQIVYSSSLKPSAHWRLYRRQFVAEFGDSRQCGQGLRRCNRYINASLSQKRCSKCAPPALTHAERRRNCITARQHSLLCRALY